MKETFFFFSFLGFSSEASSPSAPSASSVLSAGWALGWIIFSEFKVWIKNPSSKQNHLYCVSNIVYINYD